MLGKLTFFAGLLIATTVAPVQRSYAGPVSPQSLLPQVATADASVVEKTQWRRCRFWREECAERWGWHKWGYRRCLWRHGRLPIVGPHRLQRT
jgi:hypothetical protein